MKLLRVLILKRRAKRLYLAYAATQDGMGCGNALAGYITGGRRERVARLFDKTMDRLADLGEPVPKGRLAEGARHENHNS